MKKIRLVATGGFGNQLFVWSMAHEISSRQKSSVIIYFVDSSSKEFVRTGRLKELSAYCSHSLKVKVSWRFQLLLRLVDKLAKEAKPVGGLLRRAIGLYDESELSRHTDLTRVRILRGFFQESEQVFRSFESFSSELIDSLQSVAIDHLQPQGAYDFIHIRRGDYLSLAGSWGVLSMEYFVRLFRADVPTIISTDDEKSVSEISKLFPNARVLGPDTIGELQTFKLMINASRVVASNSSFSWWGAILANRLHGSEIILPNPWTRIKWSNVSLTQIPGAKESRSEFL